MLTTRLRPMVGKLVGRVRRPALSVVMPCHDEEQHLETAIRSILNQEFRDLEVIVVDDGSKDGSTEIISKLAARDRRVRLLRTDVRRGPGAARNKGIESARGKAVSFADADDIVLPGAYRAMFTELHRKGVDMVVGGYRRHGQAGTHRPHLVERSHATDRMAVPADECPDVLDEVVIWNRMFRARFWRLHVGPFPEDVNYEDREPALRSVLRARRITVLARDVYSWRLPDGRITRSQRKHELSDLSDRFTVAQREVALLEGAAPSTARRVWKRIIATDARLFAAHVPATDENYWQRFSTYAAWLVEKAPKSVWPSVDPWARLITICAARGGRADVEELLGTMAEDGTAVRFIVQANGGMGMEHPVLRRLDTHVMPELLEVDPTILQVVSAAQEVEWVEGTALQVRGYAYVPGISSETTKGLEFRFRAHTDPETDLRAAPRTDDAINIEARDPWSSYRASGFTLTIPQAGHSPTGLDDDSIELSVYATWGDWEVIGRLSVPIPPRDGSPDLSQNISQPSSPRVYLNDVRIADERLVLCGRVQGMVEELRIGIRTSAAEYSTDVSPGHGGQFRAVVRAPDGLALPGDGYFVRWGSSSGPLDGWVVAGSRLCQGPIEREGRLQRATVRRHPPTDAVSVTIGPPLSPVERSRYGQQQLRTTKHLHKRQPAVLLESFNGKTCGDNPAAIARGLQQAGIDVPLYWSVRDLSVPVPAGGTAVVIGSADWHRALAAASVLINNNNFPHWFVKHEDQFFLQTWHGTPIKKLLWDLPKDRVPHTYRRLMRCQVPMWDLLLAQNDQAAQHLRSGLGYIGDTWILEQPRNAVLAEDHDGRRRTRSALGIKGDEKAILYAPTWREPDRVASRAVDWSQALDLDDLAASTGTRVLVRGHHMSRRAPIESGRVMDVTRFPSLEHLMLASDVLVSDYSSILHDWALLGRPAVLYTPDLDHYRDVERGFYVDWPGCAPWPYCETQEELHHMLRHSLKNCLPDHVADPSVAEGRERIVAHLVGLLSGA